MYYKSPKPGGILATALVAVGICGSGAVHAFGQFGADVDIICADAGNELLPEFQPRVQNNCTACHNDGDGGSGPGRTAYLNGTDAIIEFFCPAPVPPPAPTCWV